MEKCLNCGKELIPDEEAKNDCTGKWDGHTYKASCDCMDENLRVSIG